MQQRVYDLCLICLLKGTERKALVGSSNGQLGHCTFRVPASSSRQQNRLSATQHRSTEYSAGSCYIRCIYPILDFLYERTTEARRSMGYAVHDGSRLLRISKQIGWHFIWHRSRLVLRAAIFCNTLLQSVNCDSDHYPTLSKCRCYLHRARPVPLRSYNSIILGQRLNSY